MRKGVNICVADQLPEGLEVGIEVEVESEKRADPLFSKFWKTEGDGSLRQNGYEYVLNRPVKRGQVRDALYELDKHIKPYKPIDSFNAGVHVHINVQELSLTQIINMICISACLEDVLLEFCGEKRKGNLFCLRFGDAEGVLEMLEAAVTTDNYLILYSDDIRYSFLNMKALIEYGSLEYRCMRSDGDILALLTWVDMLLSIKDAAIGYENPMKILEEISFGGAESFLKNVLPNQHAVLSDTDDLQGKVMRGARNIQDIVYCKDWSVEEEEKREAALGLRKAPRPNGQFGDIIVEKKELKDDF